MYLLLIIVDPGNRSTKDPSPEDVFLEFLHLQLEDSGHDVWSVGRALSRKHITDNVAVASMAGDGDEEGEASENSDDREGVLVVAVHVSGATNEGGREPDSFTDLRYIGVVVKSISETLEDFSPELRLVSFQIVQLF